MEKNEVPRKKKGLWFLNKVIRVLAKELDYEELMEIFVMGRFR